MQPDNPTVATLSVASLVASFFEILAIFRPFIAPFDPSTIRRIGSTSYRISRIACWRLNCI
jgi:hypothetical protein